MLLYYITDRNQFSGDENLRRELLLSKIEEAARAGVDFIQLREKDLSARELENLAGEALRVVRAIGGSTRLLINSRTDVAMATGLDGLHLRSDDLSAEVVRFVWKSPRPVIGVSCHAMRDVTRAAAEKADFAVFGPVFEKRGAASVSATGLAELRAACAVGLLTYAIGGVTLANAESCGEAGAWGVAGIRLFQENDVAGIVRVLRGF